MTISECALTSSDIDSLKQSITYLIGKERTEGNIDAISPEYVSRVLNVSFEEMEKCLKEMGA